MRKLAIFSIIAVFLFTSSAAKAQDNISTIRDEEIESYLKELAKPIFQAAGLHPDNIKIFIINDRQLNAFVAGGQNIFINTGLILESKDPSLLAGVIAHESGHISGGHLIRTQEEFQKAEIQAAIGTILGVATMAAGAPGGAGMAIAGGGQHLAMRNMLKYSRSHEEAADQAGIGFLRKAGYPAGGLVRLLEKFFSEQTLMTDNINPYVQTHPLSSERISHIRNAAQDLEDNNISEELKAKHMRVMEKLRAFLDEPVKVLNSLKDSTDVSARYGRAVAYYRIPDIEKALMEIDGLIKDFPNDAYFHELKGQILFENGRIEESIKSYKEAAGLMPDSSLIRLELAIALLATDNDKYYREAAKYLERTLIKEPKNAYAWHQIGIAYGKGGELGLSYLALAEEATLMEKNEDAEKYIELSKKYIKADSPGALKAQDILESIKKENKKDNKEDQDHKD